MPSTYDTSIIDYETAAHRKRVFDKPLDELTVTEFSKMATFIRTDLGYGSPIYLYLHEYMRQYVFERRGKNSNLIGRDVYNHTMSVAPKYYEKLKKAGKLTMEDARMFRDEGWRKIPEYI